MNRVKIGEIAPLNSGNVRGLELSGDYLKMSGLVVSAVHPEKISVSHSAIDFRYTVGNETVVRSYGLTRSDGKITSVTFPDGHSLEVVRNG